MQAYRPLAKDFNVLLVGRTDPIYEVQRLGLPVRLLRGTNSGRLSAAASRRLTRFSKRAEEGRLLRLSQVLRSMDIVHAAETAIPFSEQCAEYVSRTSAKLVLTCWENIPFRFEADARTRKRKRFVQQHCDLFLAVTPSARNALLAEGVDPGSVHVVPAGVDTKRFRPGKPTADFRARADIVDDAFLILYVGRLVAEKGVVELVQALARVPEANGRAVHLLVVGNGTEAPRIDAAANTLRCANRVHILPGVGYADVPDLYRSADLVVVPSLPTPYWQEQVGMVLVEAMASGVALVSTASGSIPDVVQNAAEL